MSTEAPTIFLTWRLDFGGGLKHDNKRAVNVPDPEKREYNIAFVLDADEKPIDYA